MSLTRKPLRSAASGHDQKTGEALNDLNDAIRSIPSFERISRKNVVYAPPMHLQTSIVPEAIMVGRCRVSKQPTSLSVSAVQYRYEDGVAKIDELTGLTVGTAYDITFLIFG
jgi:hypothetical protein